MRREVALHVATKRDVLIPFGIGVATLGAGLGTDVLAAQAATHVLSGTVGAVVIHGAGKAGKAAVKATTKSVATRMVAY